MSDEQTLVGSTVGSFRVVELLGRGATGAVYEAVDLVSGDRVALKAVRLELARDPELVRRFFDEARRVNAARNPHVARILDVGTTPQGLVYGAMELLFGETLAERLGRVQRLPI